MSDLNKSVVAYKSVRKSFEAFLRVGAALEEINNLQNYKIEAEVAAKKAREKLSRDRLALEDVKNELGVAQEGVKIAQLEAKTVMNEAKVEFDKLIDEGSKGAEYILSEARTRSLAEQQDAADEVRESVADLNNLHRDKNKLTKDIDVLNAELAKIKKRFG